MAQRLDPLQLCVCFVHLRVRVIHTRSFHQTQLLFGSRVNENQTSHLFWIAVAIEPRMHTSCRMSNQYKLPFSALPITFFLSSTSFARIDCVEKAMHEAHDVSDATHPRHLRCWLLRFMCGRGHAYGPAVASWGATQRRAIKCHHTRGFRNNSFDPNPGK